MISPTIPLILGTIAFAAFIALFLTALILTGRNRRRLREIERA